MQILSYSPKVEVYVLVEGNGTAQVVDITADIVSAEVGRVSDGSSTFSLTLQNPRWKYNDVFTPMDRIVVFATKTSRQKLLTGYITLVSKFTLYQSDFKMSGRCSLYRMQQLYWDPGLDESQKILREAYSTKKDWGGLSSTMVELLTKVGGYSEDSISIGEMPDDIVKWAYEMYEEKEGDRSQLKSFVDEFYEVLKTHGPQGVSDSGTSVSGNGSVVIMGNDAQKKVCALYASWEGQFAYSQAGGRLDPVNSGYGDCSSTIWRAYQDALGIEVGTWTGAMIGYGMEIATGSGSGLPLDKMEPADIILFNWGGYNPSYDHVELYMGNNTLMGHGGPGNGPTVKADACAYAAGASDWMVRRFVSSGDSKKK